ncbi:MAG: ParB-like nuclease domain, partial [Bacteroidota bacterium]
HCGTHNINEDFHDTSWENENGEKVSLLDLVKVTEKIPVVDFPVELLKDKVLSWDNDHNEQKKIDKSSLQYPILIFVDDDGEFLSIIDGHHRVQKAIKLGREFIDAKIAEYQEKFTNPYIAASRGFIDGT